MIVAGGRSYIICRVFHGLSNAENLIRFGSKIRKLEIFPEVESVKTSNYRNPAYDHFDEKRIAPRESARKTEQNI